MIVTRFRFAMPGIVSYLFLLFIWASSTTAWAATDFAKLDQEYQALVLNASTELKTKVREAPSNFSGLLASLHAAQASNSPLILVELLVSNENLLRENIDNREIITIFNYLLDAQLYAIAEKIFKIASLQGDAYTLSRLNYHLALYFYALGDYSKAQNTLTQIEVRNALTENESDYATLLFGIILQYQKQHRVAVKHYQSIAAKSPYFNHAQLNIAVAYIRQGWWTDAQIAINNAINNKESPANEDLLNRLYLVLGYNQLQHEFFRDARESFRHLTVDSRYADRALLGIGLCALNQGDYVGAINAFNILKSKTETNISVTEAHLLYAYAHEQLGEGALASAQYEAAIAYFNQRMLRLSKDGSGTFKEEDTNAHLIAIIDTRDVLLKNLAAQVKSNKLKSKLSQLSHDYTSLKNWAINQRKQKTLDILTSYLSQAQFGQAKLFDTLQ